MSETFVAQPLPGGNWTFYAIGLDKGWIPEVGPCTRARAAILYHKPSNSRWQTKAGFSWASDPQKYNWDQTILGGVALSYLSTGAEYFLGPELTKELKADAQATIDACLGLDSPPFEV